MGFIDILVNYVIKTLERFDTLVTEKPLVSILFPSTGLGVLYIPDNPIKNTNSNFSLELIDMITPYLKFIFLLLTVLLTVISFILQVRKLINDLKK